MTEKITPITGDSVGLEALIQVINNFERRMLIALSKGYEKPIPKDTGESP